MEVTVNDKPMQFAGETVSELLDALDMQKPYIAVSVNDSIVPRSEHTQRKLTERDQVIIVQAVGGG